KVPNVAINTRMMPSPAVGVAAPVGLRNRPAVGDATTTAVQSENTCMKWVNWSSDCFAKKSSWVLTNSFASWSMVRSSDTIDRQDERIFQALLAPEGVVARDAQIDAKAPKASND